MDTIRKSYIKDNFLSDLFKNKTAIYVCPSNYLAGKKKGTFIDSHDIVIRVNIENSLSPDLFEDYGSKTDVIISSGAKYWIDEVSKNIDLNVDLFNDIKCVVFARCSVEFGVHNMNCEIGEYFSNKTKNLIKFVQVPNEYTYSLYKNLSDNYQIREPPTGAMGLFNLLNYEFKKLTIIGMDFYNFEKIDPKKTYYSGYTKCIPNFIPHPQYQLIPFIYNLLNEVNWLFTDHYMYTGMLQYIKNNGLVRYIKNHDVDFINPDFN